MMTITIISHIRRGTLLTLVRGSGTSTTQDRRAEQCHQPRANRRPIEKMGVKVALIGRGYPAGCRLRVIARGLRIHHLNHADIAAFGQQER